MFFTPGRVIGLIAFVIVVFAVGALLKWLDSRISPPITQTIDAPSTTRSAKPRRAR